MSDGEHTAINFSCAEACHRLLLPNPPPVDAKPGAEFVDGCAGRGLTLAQVDEAVRLYKDGWSLARIGGRFSVDPTTVLTRLPGTGRGDSGRTRTRAGHPRHPHRHLKIRTNPRGTPVRLPARIETLPVVVAPLTHFQLFRFNPNRGIMSSGPAACSDDMIECILEVSSNLLGDRVKT